MKNELFEFLSFKHILQQLVVFEGGIVGSDIIMFNMFSYIYYTKIQKNLECLRGMAMELLFLICLVMCIHKTLGYLKGLQVVSLLFLICLVVYIIKN